MTTEVIVCGPSESLSTAAGIMWSRNCGCLPVVDTELRLLGMSTDRDLWLAAFDEDVPLKDIPVETAMNKIPRSCRPDDTVAEAESIMRINQVRRLPVLDGMNRLIGLLTLSDIARRTAELRREGLDITGSDALVETLAAIGERRPIVNSTRET